MVDTGATISVVKKSALDNMGKDFLATTERIKGFWGFSQSIGTTELDMCADETNIQKIKVEVMEEMDEDMIFGIEETDQLNLYTHMRKENKLNQINTIMKLETIYENLNEKNFEFLLLEEKVEKAEGLETEEQKAKLREIVLNYRQIFAEETTECAIDIEHAIELIENFNRIIAARYRRSLDEHNFISKEVDRFLKKGLIEESESTYTSTVVLVKKKNGELRFWKLPQHFVPN